MPVSGDPNVRVHPAIADIDAAAWDRLADPATFNPFVSHAFLAALERSGAVGARTGWQPCHLTLEQDGAIAGAAPCYLKTHSKGEYVFDYGWAEAYERAGGQYYPKLQIAVPFTPVPGPRFLVGAGDGAEARERLLLAGAVALAKQVDASSVHATFVSAPEWARIGADRTWLQRTDQQFHWQNAGYATFDDFLASLASRKRKAVRKERAEALSAGLSIEHITGNDVTEAHWDAFFTFYVETGSRKWGNPYLNRRFFSMLGEAMADRCLLVMAKRDGEYVAGALNLIGGDCLYGRYWGCTEHHPFLHFEICYYQAIEIAIARKLARVEAGAQGEHKLARGYMPTPTYSVHWIADPGFRKAVARYLVEERTFMDQQRAALAEYGPYRKTDAASDHD